MARFGRLQLTDSDICYHQVVSCEFSFTGLRY